MTNPFLGSSETTRVISFFKDDSSFGHYLAGLLDSYGCFYISKKNKISVEITLHEADVVTLFKLKKKLQFGIVSKRSKMKTYRIRINQKLGVVQIIELVNGKLLTQEKHLQLTKVCLLLNIVPITNNVLLKESPWFTGFFDGAGSFSIGNKYTLTLSVSQKTKDILELIQHTFDCGKINYDKFWDGHNWCITDLKNVSKMLDYFARFPLCTLKNSDAVTFKRLVLFKKRKYHFKESPYKTNIESLVRAFKKRKKI